MVIQTRRFLSFSIIFVMITAFLMRTGESVYAGEIILDPLDDVLLYKIAERSVRGHEDIDLVSLETFDRLYSIDAYLTVKGVIRDELGYIYSMTIGGVSVIYDNGTVQGMTGEGDTIDVEVEIVSGNQLHAQIRKAWVEEGEMIVNGTAQLFLLDYNGERRFENYFDVVEGEGTVSPVSRYQISLADDEDDVKFSFLESTRVEMPGMDIASFGILEVQGGFRMEISIPDKTDINQNDEFAFHLGNGVFVIGGDMSIRGDVESVTDWGFDHHTIYIEIGGEVMPGTSAYCEARSMREDGSWLEDRCPDEPLLFLDVFPFSCGSRIEMDLTIADDGHGEFRLTTSDLPEGMVDRLDSDSSGDISTTEIDEVFDGMMKGLQELVREDGITAVEDISILAGDDSFTVILELAFGDLTSVEIAPMRSLKGGSELDVDISFKVFLPEGYRILPETVSPVELSNYITDGSTGISVNSNDIRDLSLMANGVSFSLGKKTESKDGEGTSYEDVPGWAYVSGVVILAGVSLIIYRLVRGRKETPPPGEDY